MQAVLFLQIYKLILECGPMPNVMVALPNIGDTLCSMPKVLLTLTTWLPCSNAAKMRKPLTYAGVSQTPETISAVSWPKFAVLKPFIRIFSPDFRQRCALGHKGQWVTFLYPVTIKQAAVAGCNGSWPHPYNNRWMQLNVALLHRNALRHRVAMTTYRWRRRVVLDTVRQAEPSTASLNYTASYTVNVGLC